MATTDHGGAAAESPRETLLQRAYELAHEYEQKYGSCPQCVLAAVQETLDGQVDEATFKAGHSLAGGGALAGKGTCGALAGGMLTLGSYYGRRREDFGKGTQPLAFKLSKRLYDRFVAEFGGCSCADVQTKVIGRPFDMWNARDYAAFEAAGGHTDKCTDVAGQTARWTLEILLDQRERDARAKASQ